MFDVSVLYINYLSFMQVCPGDILQSVIGSVVGLVRSKKEMVSGVVVHSVVALFNECTDYNCLSSVLHFKICRVECYLKNKQLYIG